VRRPLFRSITGIALLALGCGGPAPGPPEVIYHNARIVTLRGDEIVDALAVVDGRISAVGSNAEIRRLAGSETRLVDLGGRTVVPGFYDNHIHLGGELQPWRGGMISAVSGWLREAETTPRLLAAVRRQATETPRGEWIRGSIAREIFPNQIAPTRWQLDSAAPDHPVALARGPHTLLLNSRALGLARIGRETPNPPGGWIIRDPRGEPNGRVLEAARRLVDRVMPREQRPPAGGRGAAAAEPPTERYRRFLLEMAALGITSVNVAGVGPAELRTLQSLYERHGAELPRATIQIRLSPGHDSYDDVELGIRESIALMEGLGVRTGFGTDRLKVGAIKMSIDGGLSAPVFWSLEDYDGRPGFRGAQRIPNDAFYRVARRAHELGWQLGIHTMGDAAAAMVVDQLERILSEIPRADHRHYLHHVAVLPPPATLDKMARLGIGVASQPGFTLALGAYADEALAGAREATQNPTRSLLGRGIHVSYGSDGAPFGPLAGIQAAVTRRGWDDEVHGADEAVSVAEALRLHTLESAWFSFDDARRGTLEVGKVADLTVLGDDPFTVDPRRIREVRIERTVVGGRDIYLRPPSEGGR
jgi:predicted amidohydrolase YtcJ